MKFIFILFLIIKLLTIEGINKCYSITINSIAFSYDQNGLVFHSLIDQYNNYTRDNNVDVTIELTLYSVFNSSSAVDDYGSSVEYLLNKGSTKYDIIFYDTMYTPQYSSHLLDLSKYLPKEHISLYSNGVANLTCAFNGKWLAFPTHIEYNVIYANKYYLNKYEKDIPKTWNELLETAKYIITKERENGNKNILGYNGLFPVDEKGFSSAIEYLYSFRENIDSPFPDYLSKESIKAFDTLKKLKKEISSDETFKGGGLMEFYTNNAIFFKFGLYNFKIWNYVMIPIVGNKEGISGSTIGGFNMGINKHISEQKRKYALDAISFITSKEIQKNFMKKTLLFSAMNDLYDDEEICQRVDCNLVKKLQPISRSSIYDLNYDEHSKEFRNYLGDFLYGNLTSSEQVLEKIKDITYVYYISINPHKSSEGFFIFLISISMIIIILISPILLYINRYKDFFKFLNVDAWILYMQGLIINICAIFMEYGNLTNFKCHFKIILILVGMSLRQIQILYRLIANFPIKFSIIEWITNKKYLFIIVLITNDILSSLLFFFTSFNPTTRIVKNGKNFKYCNFKDYSGIFIVILLFIEKASIVFIVTMLIFMEWNKKKTTKNVRLMFAMLYIDTLMIALLLIVYFSNFKSYSLNFLIKEIIILIFCFSNYIIIFFSRVFWSKKRNEENDIIDDALNRFKRTISSVNTEKSDEVSHRRSQLVLKLMEYHNYTGSDEVLNQNCINNTSCTLIINSKTRDNNDQ